MRCYCAALGLWFVQMPLHHNMYNTAVKTSKQANRIIEIRKKKKSVPRDQNELLLFSQDPRKKLWYVFSLALSAVLPL